MDVLSHFTRIIPVDNKMLHVRILTVLYVVFFALFFFLKYSVIKDFSILKNITRVQLRLLLLPN